MYKMSTRHRGYKGSRTSLIMGFVVKKKQQCLGLANSETSSKELLDFGMETFNPAFALRILCPGMPWSVALLAVSWTWMPISCNWIPQ